MHFETWSEFFAMGGYASYVWSAFGITFGSMLLLAVISRHQTQKTLQEVEKRIQRKARIDAAKNMENTL
jgi:heme exporter protein D